jgi:tetratricopeptide (TPR) repeat protein
MVSFFSKKILFCLWTAFLWIAFFSISQAQDETLPKWETMKNFCKVALKEIQSTEQESQLFPNVPLNMEFIQKIWAEEKRDALKVVESKKYKTAEEKFKNFIQFGLYESALAYLESKQFMSPEDRAKAPLYFLHLAFVQRWLEQEEKHLESCRRVQDTLAKRKRFPHQKEIQAATEFYQAKYVVWVRLSPKFKEYKKLILASPQKLKNWENFAEVCSALYYPIEEIVAQRAICQILWQDGMLSAKEIFALGVLYLKIEQPEKTLALTEKALQVHSKHPMLYALRIKAYNFLKQPAQAKKEWETLIQEFPHFSPRKKEIMENKPLEWGD